MNPEANEKWFLHIKGQVQGPYNQENLQNTIKNMGNEASEQALVWKQGLAEWIKANKWQLADNQIISKNKIEIPNENPSDNLFEKTYTQATIAQNYFYQVQIDFIDQPPMSKAELLTMIAKQEDVSKVSIQDPSTKEWKDVFAFPDIIERLGISRRAQARVPILAQFTGKTNKNDNVTYRVITISQGGMGITENFDLKIGDEVEGQITSPHLFHPINIKAEVIYSGQDGYIGLKFSQIPDEAVATIIDYIKKFGKKSANTPL